MASRQVVTLLLEPRSVLAFELATRVDRAHTRSRHSANPDAGADLGQNGGMRRKHLAPCSRPGCPNLTRDSLCAVHRLEAHRRSDAKRPNSSQRGYGARWRKCAKAYLRAHPTCEMEPGCSAPATEVDHIDGLGPNGPRGFDWSNLRSGCKRHHSRRTGRDHPVGGRSR